MEPAPLLIVLEVGNSISPLKKAMVMPSLVSTDMRSTIRQLEDLSVGMATSWVNTPQQVQTNCSVWTQLPSPDTQSTPAPGGKEPRSGEQRRHAPGLIQNISVWNQQSYNLAL